MEEEASCLPRFRCFAAAASSWLLLLPFGAVILLLATGQRWENDTLMLSGVICTALAAPPVLAAVRIGTAGAAPPLVRLRASRILLRLTALFSTMCIAAGLGLCVWRRQLLWGNIKSDDWFEIGHTLAVSFGSNGLAVIAAAVGLRSLHRSERGLRQLLLAVCIGHGVKCLLAPIALAYDVLQLHGELTPRLEETLTLVVALPHLLLIFLFFLDIPALLAFATRLLECRDRRAGLEVLDVPAISGR